MNRKILIFTFLGFLWCTVAFTKDGRSSELGMKNTDDHGKIAAIATTIQKSTQNLAVFIQKQCQHDLLKQRLAKQMEEQHRPEILIPRFMPHLQSGKMASISVARRSASLTKTSSVGISGRVTVAGNSPDPNYPIIVVAFDSLGYFAGQSENVDSQGNYVIAGLKAGFYYVMTVSNYYVDEIYDNWAAPLNDRSTWRSATKVQVKDGQITPDIHFDLQNGAKITGRLFHAGGISPIQEQEVTFIFTKKEVSSQIYEKTCYIFSGSYDINVPFTGEYKMAVKTDDYALTWFGNTLDWNAAQTINVAGFQSVLNNINVTLISDPKAALCGSLGGTVGYSDRTDVPMFSACYAFRIDGQDTVFADLAIGLFGTYTFESLLQGNYIIYGNDILGDLLSGSNYLGQYFQNAATPQQAKPVRVVAGVLTEGVNFVLQRGGSISGYVRNGRGAPIDSILVMAFPADMSSSGGAGLFPTNVAVYLCGTDGNGRYQLNGLPTGDYYVRTISDSLLNVEQLGFTLKFRKHGGKYVDAYYPNGQNLFDLQAAKKVAVTVPNTTDHIDFVLEDAKYFTGTVKDAISGAPVTNIVLFALDESFAYPYIALQMFLKKQVKENGDFRLGPLPAGRYKLIAVAGGLEFKTDYLSEFYDGVRDFTAAQVVTLGQSDQGGIHFTLDRGAVIQGFVYLPHNGGTIRAGADVLDGFPVLVYHAESGQLASLDFVQFTGGYRIDHLLPGNYKILALPTLAPYAATYYGGGDTFMDPSSQIVTLTQYGEIKDCPITLEQANGSIAGHVWADGQPAKGLSQVMVIAYDASGHPCGLAMSDMDIRSGWVNPNAEGVYAIEGLRSGQYFLRTFSLSTALGSSQQVLGLADIVTGGLDLFSLLGNLSSITSLFNLDISMYQDQWYQNIDAIMDLDIFSLVFQLTAYGVPNTLDEALLPIYLPLPMAEDIPSGAAAVSVGDGSRIEGKDFILQQGDLGHMFTGVERKTTVPQAFMVLPNYPNPFNPTTTITLQLPSATHVSVIIYNVSGQRVKTLSQAVWSSGTHSIRWHGVDDLGQPVPAGIYLAQVRAGNWSKTIKMTLLK